MRMERVKERELLYQTPGCHPFVKWAGGKGQLIPQIIRLIPTRFARYFEPFLGGGAVFFQIASSDRNAFLSDINIELIDAYKVIKNHVEELIPALIYHENQYNKSPKKYYYHLRDSTRVMNKIDKAARFIALNKTCYNGLYRVNRKGLFNVPWGKYKDPVICNSKNLRNVSLALQRSNAIIQVSDYKEVLLKNAKEGDFIYLDPPYRPSSSTAYFTRYTDAEFTDKGQRDIANIFEVLTKRKCKVMLSNSNTPLIRELYAKLAKDVREVNAIRAINCKGSGRIGHTELIIRNYSQKIM